MEYKLAAVETKFADIIWENEPLSTSELIALCAKELNWKRTTTYTVLKKLCERGIMELKDGRVTALIKKEEFYSHQCADYIDTTFRGSLPLFVAAFTKQRKVTQEEKDELLRMIEKL